MKGRSYIVAGSRPWNRDVFERRLRHLPGNWVFVSNAEELADDRLASLSPRYVFFLHWSAKVPTDLLSRYECVCFHMTDVPYGRGGSPLQNLIVRGHRETRLTALRMVEAFDAGPVYQKRPLTLEGSAQQIYKRAGELSADIIEWMVGAEPVPTPQEGDVVVFKRRKPAESRVPPLSSLEDLYDFIRMLDADEYPRAYVTEGGFRYEFSSATLGPDGITAQVRITREESGE